MGGCATKPNKLDVEGTDMKQEDEVEVVEVVKKVVQVETKDIEGSRKSLSLLFLENKKENMECNTEESTKFEYSLEHKKPPKNAEEELQLPAASQEYKNASVIAT